MILQIEKMISENKEKLQAEDVEKVEQRKVASGRCRKS
jgi:hypothetical protein